MTDDETNENNIPPVSELKSRQRRVLGVLVEKAFTTPEYYPLTLKAVTTGCNQKSNRSPVVNWSEDDVFDTLDQLRKLGLAAVVHTESGRTERFRHYIRKRFTLSEPQIAILTELLLRGRQQLGELRSRASRMVPIDSLDRLREELAGLIRLNLAQSSGNLERRGIEVDHNLYTEKERPDRTLATAPETGSDAAIRFPEPVRQPVAAVEPQRIESPTSSAEMAAIKSEVNQLRHSHEDLREVVSRLEETVTDLQREVETLKQDLGVS